MVTPITFLKQTYDELKKVKWPTRNEITRLTIVVIFISFAIGLYIGGIDFILTKIMGALLLK
jgi:preprotein translocase subunit SecE